MSRGPPPVPVPIRALPYRRPLSSRASLTSDSAAALLDVGPDQTADAHQADADADYVQQLVPHLQEDPRHRQHRRDRETVQQLTGNEQRGEVRISGETKLPVSLSRDK